jgi:hypothetical protein
VAALVIHGRLPDRRTILVELSLADFTASGATKLWSRHASAHLDVTSVQTRSTHEGKKLGNLSSALTFLHQR